MKIQTVIFDFDYTLVDSSRGVESCINYALRELGFSQISYEAACQTIGLSLHETYAAITGESASLGDEFRRLFVERADEVMADNTVLFQETPEAIHTLSSLGMTLGIVSTKFRYRIERILARENLSDFFSVIVGGEDVINHKPHPESLLLALEKLGSSPQASIYAGDSVVDAKTAQNVGIPFAAVLSGVTPRSAFDAFVVNAVLENVGQLPAWISDSPL